MLLAVLADVHANREALEACLAHSQRQGASGHVFLGDLVGYGADPAWVVERVMDMAAAGAVAIRGNHDEAVGSPRPGMRDDAARAVAWTRDQLCAAQREFLAQLPLRHEDDPLLYVHANGWAPQDFEYILGPFDAGRSLRAVRQPITFCGHSHDPALYHMGLTQRVEEFKPVPGVPIVLSATRRWLAIPGSCGQPRDGNPAACYATWDPLHRMLTWWRVPYDYATAATKVRAAGLPQRLATRLEGGV
ncbi:MAG: metallophosphoesterase family protein [Burkholderiaceae bacterium]